METKFFEAFMGCREKAAALGVRIRPAEKETAVKNAKRILAGSRYSDGFDRLAELGRLELSLEALATEKRFGVLFTDDEVNEALMRLLSAGYNFKKR